MPGRVEGLVFMLYELRHVAGRVAGGGLRVLRGSRVLTRRGTDVPGGVLDPDSDSQLSALRGGERRSAQSDPGGHREAGDDDSSHNPSHRRES
jgi:hypothetical protein